ncbi:hypothetical protein ACLB2K_033597 [Fragaria x ananassa]
MLRNTPKATASILMHFRCVSKSWKALLPTDHVFWRIHRNFHPHNTGHLLLKAGSGSGSDATLKKYLLLVKASQEGNTASHVTDLVTPPCLLHKMRYANGLVLGHSIYNSVYIFNPFTRDCCCSISYFPIYRLLFRLQSSYEYKVVATQNIAGLVGFKIFTLGQGSGRNMVVDWHHLPFVHPPPSDFWNNTVCINGVLHWLASSYEAIYALDIGDERLRIIPLPAECKLIQRRHKKIIEVDKCLCIVCENMIVWILKDYKYQVWVAETIKVPYYVRCRTSSSLQCSTHTGDIVFDVSAFAENHPQLYDRKSKSSRQSKIIFPKMLCDLGLRLKYSAVSFDDCVTPLK